MSSRNRIRRARRPARVDTHWQEVPIVGRNHMGQNWRMTKPGRDQNAGPHSVSFASERRGHDWFMNCGICGVALVNKHRADNLNELFIGHDGRPDLDIERAAKGMPNEAIPLEYCCASMGWVPPDVRFDHQWDDTGGWDE